MKQGMLVEEKVGDNRRRKKDSDPSCINTCLGEIFNLTKYEMCNDVNCGNNGADDYRLEKSQYHSPQIFLRLLMDSSCGLLIDSIEEHDPTLTTTQRID